MAASQAAGGIKITTGTTWRRPHLACGPTSWQQRRRATATRRWSTPYRTGENPAGQRCLTAGAGKSRPDCWARVPPAAVPRRVHGLFPRGDELLLRLAATQGAQPFEKHLSGVRGPYELLPKGGWATGDAAARSGVDLRLFYLERQTGETHGTVQGAVRFGGGASIGNGFWISAHGGAIETVLDEATAELAKMDFVPVVSTVEAAFKIKKAVPLHTSLLVQCSIKEQRGIRCWVEGQLCSADKQTVFATCDAQLVNLTNWL